MYVQFHCCIVLPPNFIPMHITTMHIHAPPSTRKPKAGV